jgi:CheY-like chemotaxis protein
MTMNAPILLVEDNKDDETLTLRALRKSNILNDVVVVRDGAEALDYLFIRGTHAARDPAIVPQVILMDLNLPKVSGLNVLKQLRADERTQMLPVVVLTSSKEDEDIIESYKLGANSYIRKPVELARFTEAVKTLGLYWLLLNESLPSRRSL